MQDRHTGIKELKIFAILEAFSHFYNVLRPLCTQGVLNFQAHGIWRLIRYRVHSLYKGHLPIKDTSGRYRGVRNSEVPLYVFVCN